MQVALSDLKDNASKYIDLAETTDVIITKYGKPAAKIIRFNKEPWYSKEMPTQITSVEQLFGTLPSDIDLEDVKTGRLTKWLYCLILTSSWMLCKNARPLMPQQKRF